ncbi:MAG TPA: hypothetical protein VNJ53_05400 [Gaiellaceae bacterium]|nr:hypothetical protein [Gaiellaceae bacterium]
MEVLLVGGDDRSMLAAGRSLSDRGIGFAAIGLSPASAFAWSRHLRGRIVPTPVDVKLDPDRLGEFVVEVAARPGVEVVVPLTDRALEVCDRHRARIEVNARLAAPPSHAVRDVLDKRANLERARRLGIPCPEQFDLESLDQIVDLAETVGFPLVLKNPSRTAVGRTLGFSWLVADSEEEVRRLLLRHCPDGPYPLVQRLIRGTVHNICCFAVRGELVVAHQYEARRRTRGLTTYREVVPLASRLRGHAESMLRDLGWEGVAHVGFFVEPNGDVRYMETNGRLWASVAGSIASGWDFPFWIYEYFGLDRVPVAPSQGGIGRRSRWHYGELMWLADVLRGRYDASTIERTTRWRAVVDYFAGFSPRVAADVFRLDDPTPELMEHLRGLRGVVANAVRGVGRSRRMGRIS